MSDVLHGIGDELGGDDDPSRRRSLWVLLALFVAAALVAILMVALGSGSSNQAAPPAEISAPVVFQSSTPSRPKTSESSEHPTLSTAPALAPAGVSNVPSGNPCPTAPGCVLNGDGGVLAAINALRLSKHLSVVQGAISAAGQQCALSLGNGPTCKPHYIYTYPPSLDGEKGVQGTLSFNPSWLLDPQMTRVEFGWAYQKGKYVLAILKWP